ncbi:MAG: hypothetical protein HDT40_10715 [Lachnospiraceae bacterium]|nr:hypothetical protein [Lachnospiraceae bacterium]
MKSLMSFLLGIVLTIVGAVLFLSNVKVTTFTFFYRYKEVNVTAILMLLMCIFFVAYIVYTNFVTGLILGVLFLLFIISIILSMKFHIMYMSALEVMLILMTFFGGIGLTLRGIVHSRDELGDDTGNNINNKVNRK